MYILVKYDKLIEYKCLSVIKELPLFVAKTDSYKHNNRLYEI